MLTIREQLGLWWAIATLLFVIVGTLALGRLADDPPMVTRMPPVPTTGQVGQ